MYIFDYYQFSSVSLPLYHDDFECLRVARVAFYDVLQLRGAKLRARSVFVSAVRLLNPLHFSI